MVRTPLATTIAFAVVAVAAAACFDASDEEPPVRFSDVVRGVEGDGVLLYRVESFVAGGSVRQLGSDNRSRRLPERTISELWLHVADGELTDTVARLSTTDGEVLDISAGPASEANLGLDLFTLVGRAEELRNELIAGERVLAEHPAGGIDVLVRGLEACPLSGEQPVGQALERYFVFSADLYPTGSYDCVIVTSDGREETMIESNASLEALPASTWPAIAALVEE
jgi:hypothetical protein